MKLLKTKQIVRSFYRFYDEADNTMVGTLSRSADGKKWHLCLNGIYYRNGEPTTYGGSTVKAFETVSEAMIFAGAVWYAKMRKDL